MPLRPRVDAPGTTHHVVAKGSAGESIVRDDGDREILVVRLGQAVRRYEWSCLAYCLLDTHFHLVVRTPQANLGRGMQWLLATYAREFNERHKREGNLFHTRFYSKHIESDEQFTSTVIYVHLNPVRAGLVSGAEHWRWSSFGATVGRAEVPAFLNPSAVLDRFDTRRDVARLRFELAVREALELDRERTGLRHGV